jgi:hypothetical protein
VLGTERSDRGVGQPVQRGLWHDLVVGAAVRMHQLQIGERIVVDQPVVVSVSKQIADHDQPAGRVLGSDPAGQGPIELVQPQIAVVLD